MAATDPSVARRRPQPRLRWALWALVPLAVLAALGLYIAVRPSSESAPPASADAEGPAATWAAGELKAPDFRLTDQNAKPISLASIRGRPVILTFLDPKCTTFCPRESIVLNDAVSRLPAGERPAIVAVNVNPPVHEPAVLRREAKRFRWLPEWRWASGPAQKLRAVWTAYHIQVVPTRTDVGHTEAAYVVDRDGNQRALFLWPFRAAAVASAVRSLR